MFSPRMNRAKREFIRVQNILPANEIIVFLLPTNYIPDFYIVLLIPALRNFKGVAYGTGAFDWREAEWCHVVDVADFTARIYVSD